MIKFSMDRSSVSGFRYMMKEFMEEAKKTESEAIQLLAKACAKELAITVPPFGLSSKVGEKFQKSIAKQINRAVKSANVKGIQGSAESVHSSSRDARGQVPKNLKTRGKFQREPIPVKEKEDLIDKKQRAAGMAKGAWIAAAEKLNGKKISGVGKWVRQHATTNGKNEIRADRNGTIVMLTNSVSYIEKLHRKSYIETALRRGKLRNWRHMVIAVKKIRKEI